MTPVRWGTITVAAFLLAYSLELLILWAYPVESPWRMGPVVGTRFALLWNDRTMREVTADDLTRYRESEEGSFVFVMRRERVLLFYGLGDLAIAAVLLRLGHAAHHVGTVAVASVAAGLANWARASYLLRGASGFRDVASVGEFFRLQDQWQRANAGVVAAWAVLGIGAFCGVLTVVARGGGYRPMGQSTGGADLAAAMRAKTDEDLSKMLAAPADYTDAALEAARRVLQERRGKGTDAPARRHSPE